MEQKILKAAERIFSEKGFYRAKIYQIAEVAGVSVGTIYRFFESKEELYLAVLKWKAKELEERVKVAISGKDPDEAIQAYIEAVIGFFKKEKHFLEIFIREIGGLTFFAGDLPWLSDWYFEYLKMIAAVVKEGVDKGIFKNVKPLGVALIISGALKNVIYCCSKDLLEISEDEMAELLKVIVLEGVLK